jgi:hypothetical protein
MKPAFLLFRAAEDFFFERFTLFIQSSPSRPLCCERARARRQGKPDRVRWHGAGIRHQRPRPCRMSYDLLACRLNMASCASSSSILFSAADVTEDRNTLSTTR